ncbi:type II toxin-antitoxin system HicB family antitoxin [Crocosphaera chwakensis]|uniref:HicB-like antitoxin of toxin-antitoxin system domain-containing protein n=1 Tax=Crocosphaera chwakensis CCY0110 TaxID=391612 RepID=A3IK51_9CHRO|nr:type II toxin-antitoxin system HicB family antitoxin [Crocosphaera chwakensis]EAZ93040.1 hypothetical protein CY0110_03189 [Crocosphaera chwakensis CCY0110]
MNNPKYTMIIQWSEEDNCYVVGFSDFPGQQWRTHGNSYTEAVSNGVEVLELLIEDYQIAGETLPVPKTYYDQVA